MINETQKQGLGEMRRSMYRNFIVQDMPQVRVLNDSISAAYRLLSKHLGSQFALLRRRERYPALGTRRKAKALASIHRKG